MSRRGRPKVVFFYDREGWAFHNICREAVNHLTNEFDVEIHPFWPTAPPYVDAEVCFLMWYGSNHLFKKVPSSCRKVTCVYDESLWTFKDSFRRQFEDAARQSNMMMGASPNIERLLQDNVTHPVFPCYDGINVGKFPQRPFREDFLTTPLRVGWAGNSDPGAHGDNKGLHIIKEVAASMPHIDFVIQDRRGKKVWIPHDKMTDWYADLDVILCMSRHEGTPNPILEASATGRAWISTDVGIVRAMANDSTKGEPGLIISRSAHALRHAIETLNKNREKVLRMGEAGRSAIDNGWRWWQKMEQFRTVIRQALR